MTLERLISGGQTGVDQASWRAAKALSIPTGGLMPLGYRTEGTPGPDGRPGPDEDHPEFAAEFGATQHHSRDYPPRTRANVEAADLALIINVGPRWSAGTMSAKSAAERSGRRYVVVDLYRPMPDDDEAEEGKLASRVAGLWRPDDATGKPRYFPVESTERAAGRLREHLARHGVRTLFVGGNRESSVPGIGAWAEAFLLEVLARST